MLLTPIPQSLAKRLNSNHHANGRGVTGWNTGGYTFCASGLPSLCHSPTEDDFCPFSGFLKHSGPGGGVTPICPSGLLEGFASVMRLLQMNPLGFNTSVGQPRSAGSLLFPPCLPRTPAFGAFETSAERSWSFPNNGKIAEMLGWVGGL